jgi:hypothetical protein
MKRKILLTLIGLFIVVASYSQVSIYSFTQTSNPYTPNINPTRVIVGNTTSDDQRFVDPAVPLGGTVNTGVGLPIGFNFTFNGTVYDRFAINNNGWISLGQSALSPAVNIQSSSGYTPISSTSTATPAALQNHIAGLARDLQGQAGSELSYQTLGTAPNRILVVQWTNYRRFSGTGQSYNFQIILSETTNTVGVSYGSFTESNATSGAPQVGLRGNTNTDFNNRTGAVWAASIAGAVNNASMTLTPTSIPTSGQLYVWTPPPPCAGVPVAGIVTPASATVCQNQTVAMTSTVLQHLRLH